MALQKKIKAAYLFENGNLAVFNLAGQQVPELQGLYSIEKHQRILLEATDDFEFRGFEILPSGFRHSAQEWANHFRERDVSFEEIEKL